MKKGGGVSIIEFMATVKIVQLSRLIELLGDEVKVKLEQPLVLRKFPEALAGNRQEVREWIFSVNRLSPDIFIIRGNTCISLHEGIEKGNREKLR
jgi:hypothetical protein